MAQSCAAAVDRGAQFKIFDGTVRAADLARTYRRRARHVNARVLENDGFADAVAALDQWKPGDVRLGQVSDVASNRHFQLFIAPLADDVIACLSVHHDY